MIARMTGRRTAGAILLAALVFFAGCSNAPPEGEVSGLVTIDGQPAGEGTYITFTPADGVKTPQGAELKEGKYTLRVAVGKANVAVRSPRKNGEKKLYATPDSPVVPTFEERLPAKYNNKTTLSYDVTEGKQEKSWELSTKGK